MDPTIGQGESEFDCSIKLIITLSAHQWFFCLVLVSKKPLFPLDLSKTPPIVRVRWSRRDLHRKGCQANLFHSTKSLHRWSPRRCRGKIGILGWLILTFQWPPHPRALCQNRGKGGEKRRSLRLISSFHLLSTDPCKGLWGVRVTGYNFFWKVYVELLPPS